MVRFSFLFQIIKKKSGGQECDLYFTMGTNTTAYYSCSTILNGEMVVFGGTEPGDYTKQVHISYSKAPK